MDIVTLSIIEGPDYRVDHEADEREWPHHAYVVELTYQGRTMQTPWKQGLGITDDPNARDVLESLLLDAISYDYSADFEDWAGQYGYDEDSRKACALYAEVGKQARNLRRLLGLGANPWETIGSDAEQLARQYTD